MSVSGKYDLIFSLGAACSCTQVLRKNGLQLASYPFDWLYGSTFDKRVDILTAGFADFINQNDLEYIGRDNGQKQHLCDVYYNKATDITFNHDFPAGMPLAEAYVPVKEKYHRRGRRLLAQIKAARRVLAVWIEAPNCADKLADASALLSGWQKLSSHFLDTEIDLLYISNSPAATDDQTHPHIRFVRADYTFEGEEAHVVNPRPLNKILSVYRLRSPLFNPSVQLPLFDKLLLSLLPFKKLRRKMIKKHDNQ